MTTKLGIYLDVNTVNWTLFNAQNDHLIDAGVHVFRQGCENFGMGKREVSRVLSKRMHRLLRIRYARIRTRKIYLLKVLIDHKMCPLSDKALYHWKKTKQFPFAELEEWLKMNPYHLRVKALHEPITLTELGRVFYQVMRHRGYRYGERTSTLSEGILSNGVPKLRRVGYVATQNALNGSTLGQYLHGLLPQEGQSYVRQDERVRNRICTMQMYHKELHRIWAEQAKHHPVLTQALRDEFIGPPESNEPGGILFYHRPIKTQKYNVGSCVLEPQKTRCIVSSLIHQELLAWQWAHSIECSSRSLTLEEITSAAHYFLRHYRFKFIEVKHLFRHDAHDEFNYKDAQIIKGSFVNTELSKSKFFGPHWFKMPEKIKEDVFHALIFYTSTSKLEQCAMEKFDLSARSAYQFSRIKLNRTYARFSKKACRNILYFLQAGYPMNSSIYLAGCKNAMGYRWTEMKAPARDKLIAALNNVYQHTSSHALLDKTIQFFQQHYPGYRVPIKKLYGFSHHQNRKDYFKQKMAYGKSADLDITHFKNGLVTQSVFILRKILNQIVDDYGPIGSIHCELSVDLKVNRMQRFTHRMNKRFLAKKHKKYLTILRAFGEDVLLSNVLKLELWEECQETCPYSGQHIPLEMLFTNHVSIVYIHPWSRSLNDSRLNKTLCFTSLAEQLKERTPYEFFQEEEIETWEKVKTRVYRLFSSSKEYPSRYRKYKNFVKRYNHLDLNKRQFHDSHPYSHRLEQLLRQMTTNIRMLPGNITSMLIDEFLLNSIVKKDKVQHDYGVRVFRAYVNTLCTEKHIGIIAKRNRYKHVSKKEKFPLPQGDYLAVLEKKWNEILVTHQRKDSIVSTRKIKGQLTEKSAHHCSSTRGSLHKETLYGLRQPPLAKNKALHLRRPLSSIETLAQVNKIADMTLRNLILKALKRVPVPDGKFDNAILMDHHPDGTPIPQIFMPNRKGDYVPVFKVRMREIFSSTIQLKTNQNRYVIPRNNHHIMIYSDAQGEYHEEVVTFWQAIQRFRATGKIYSTLAPEKGKVVTCMHINDLYLLGIDEQKEDLKYLPYSQLKKHLYRVQKLSSRYYEFRLAHKQVSSVCEYPEYIRINNFGARKTGWKNHMPIKVQVSITGKLMLNTK